jgi:hypothetical protein
MEGCRQIPKHPHQALWRRDGADGLPQRGHHGVHPTRVRLRGPQRGAGHRRARRGRLRGEWWFGLVWVRGSMGNGWWTVALCLLLFVPFFLTSAYMLAPRPVSQPSLPPFPAPAQKQHITSTSGVPLRVPAPRMGAGARAAGRERLRQSLGRHGHGPRGGAALLRAQRGRGGPGVRGGYEGVCVCVWMLLFWRGWVVGWFRRLCVRGQPAGLFLPPVTYTHTNTHHQPRPHILQVGIKYSQLLGTVGIHPTNAEELVNALPSKSSGASAAKAGC